MERSAIEQNRWDDVNQEIALVYKPHNIELKDVFQRYLSRGGECFEVGCYPGRYLIYFGKEFGYRANGIDATPLVTERLVKYIQDNGVEVGNVFCGDFFQHNDTKTYDLVFSFGFLEHFYDVENVFKRHIALMKDTGTLILACPNFRKLQYIMHLIVDPKGLKQHVLSTMDLCLWKKILEENGLEVLEQGYSRTSDFWAVEPREGKGWARLANIFERVTKSIDKRVNFPNSFLSPFMYTVARKKNNTI